MKSRILTRHLPALLALLLAGPVLAADAPAAALPTPAPGILLDRVVAVVNDGVITQSEFDERLQQAIADFRRNNNAAPPPDSVLRPAVLERLIMDKVQYQRAQRIGIKISDEDLNAQLRQLAEENGMTLDQLPAALAQQGINYASFRDNYREEIARRQVRRSEVYNRVNITPRELDQFMERLKKLPDTEAEYNFSHILIAVPFEATQDDFAAAKARAEEVYEKAATEDFAQLAVEYSQGQTALEGGQMGWRAGADLPTLLAETIASLKPGEVSRPIQAANGYHIVRLNDLRTGVGDPVQQQTHARHILLTPNALQDDATVRQRLIEIRNRVLAARTSPPSPRAFPRMPPRPSKAATWTG
jgi:peptidyl-prolyl cis-trans isomerase SurA